MVQDTPACVSARQLPFPASTAESSVHSPFPHDKLVQWINFSHFQNRRLFIFLEHYSYQEGIWLAACASAVVDKLLSLTWVTPLDDFEVREYQVSSLLIPHKDGIIAASLTVVEADSTQVTVTLGESCLISRRQGPRHSGLGAEAEISQNAMVIKGDLVDFGGGSFLVRVKNEEAEALRWLNPEENLTLRLFSGQTLVYAEDCRLIRQKKDHLCCDLALTSNKETIKRFPARRIRNPRKEIYPAPQVQFLHPLTGKKIYREIADISTSGFSLAEPQKEETLFPGLILPQVTITSGGIIRLKGSAQVIFRRRQGGMVTFGLAILDMDIRSFSTLSHIIANNMDPRACVSTELDLDELWEFLFDTDFIYPAKYGQIKDGREEIKETFRRIYLENLEISRHFTYEKNGYLSAHIAMLRAYETSWMIHHFAARPLESRLTGFLVLRQLLLFLNGFHRLPSANMDYILTYYRPTNRIIEKIFGGFADHIKDLKACSQDLFSYFRFSPPPDAKLGGEWQLQEATPADGKLLKRFYDNESGGMLLECLNLWGRKPSAIEGAYAREGLTRRHFTYCLSYKKMPLAFIVVNHSPCGLNLSELLNCIKVILPAPADLPWETLAAAIAQVACDHPLKDPPVMIYPAGYAEKQALKETKEYQLWILNSACGAPFLEYLERKFRLKVG